MSIEYHDETNKKIEEHIADIVAGTPEYVQAFCRFIQGRSRQPRTRLAYMSDVILFLTYECGELGIKDADINQIDEDVLRGLTVSDIEEYRDKHLRGKINLKASSIKRKLSALSLFFRFLSSRGYIEKNPMELFDHPKLNDHPIIRLEPEECRQLLSGVLANDKYLIESYEYLDNKYKDLDTVIRACGFKCADIRAYADKNRITPLEALNGQIRGDVKRVYDVVDIPEDVRFTREKLVLRNYAIIRLFLGSGLRVSELVGLDLNDINWKRGSLSIVKKGGGENEVYFSDSVADDLKMYIDGPGVDYSCLDKYDNRSEILEFCASHVSSPDLAKAAEEKGFPAEMLPDIKTVILQMLRQGRDGLHPKRNCDAVFVSTRGTRMSVASVEKMIKEMARTYLPDCKYKDKLSCHKLRATCATRILLQSNGALKLVSEQLGHKGVNTASRFYAELKKSEVKAQIQKLSVDEW